MEDLENPSAIGEGPSSQYAFGVGSSSNGWNGFYECLRLHDKIVAVRIAECGAGSPDMARP